MAFFDFFSKCKRYNLPLWKCPSFLFVAIGITIILVIILIYVIGTKYLRPEEVIFAMMGITVALWTLNYVIVNTFEQLAEASLMKTEFVRIISHQLRTPLSNLKWILETLTEEKDQEKRREYFAMVKDNNSRMIKLVEDMLFASKIEQGKWISIKEEISFEAVLNKVVNSFFHLAKQKSIEIKVEIEKKLPKISINLREIHKVISKLLENAIYYTKEGGKIEIRLKKNEQGIRCEIKDSGAGIPRQEQKYIFQKFFRSGNVLKYQTEGMGLSLFIVKGIIENLKGRVGFKSQEGKGSNFWFEISIKCGS